VSNERSQAEIKADPHASREELLWLRKQTPLAALAHPNCPADLWWELATHHPMEAQESVLYSMLTLESPERWAQLERTNLERWIRDVCNSLSRKSQHLFAADCAERVLPIFERKHPNDKRPREAIRLRRLFAKKEATVEQWNTARNEARSIFHKGGFINISAPKSWFAVRGAADTSAELEVQEAAESAVFTAATHATSESHEAKAFERAAYLERKWQWERLQEYLKDDEDL
jgi:hypothetical protein